MTIEYVLIFEEDGIPVYSSCISGFCTTLQKSPDFLDKMLMNLSQVPKSINQEKSLVNTYSIDEVKFYFYNQGKTFLVFAVQNGMARKELNPIAVKLFQKLNSVSNLETKTVSEKINETISHLDHLFKSDKKCPAGKNCPLDLNLQDTVWKQIKANFE